MGSLILVFAVSFGILWALPKLYVKINNYGVDTAKDVKKTLKK